MASQVNLSMQQVRGDVRLELPDVDLERGASAIGSDEDALAQLQVGYAVKAVECKQD